MRIQSSATAIDRLKEKSNLSKFSRNANDVWSSTRKISSSNNLLRHFNYHGKDFAVNSPQEYAQAARKFQKNPPIGSFTRKLRNNDVAIYDRQSNTLLISSKSGVPRTFYKPSPYSSYNDRGYDPSFKTPEEYVMFGLK